MWVPPGGFAGFAQMTPASRAALTPKGSARTGGRRRGRKAKASGSMRRRKRKSGGGRKVKFGSPAFRKKYGAKAKRNARKARA